MAELEDDDFLCSRSDLAFDAGPDVRCGAKDPTLSRHMDGRLPAAMARCDRMR